MADRRKTYAILARLHSRELEAQARSLIELQQGVAKLHDERKMLERRRQEGADVTMIEAMPYRGHFLNVVRRENQRIAKDIEAISARIDTQREKVLDCYRNAKSNEVLAEAVHAEHVARQKQVEQTQIQEQILLRRIGGYS